MSGRDSKDRISEIEELISEGRYNSAAGLLGNLNYNDLTENDRKKYDDFRKILGTDGIYILVSAGLFIIIVTYFLLVK